MLPFAGSSILQAAVAFAVVSLLVRIWKLERPDQRLPYRLLVLAVPLVLHPALMLLAPFRRAAWFEERYGLLTLESWERIHVLGVPLTSLLIPVAATIGLALFVRDLLSAAGTRLYPHAGPPMSQDLARDVAEISDAVAREMRLAPPRLVTLDDEEPHLFCAGIRSPRLVVSRGAVELLAPEELRAALAHELAHQEQGDLKTGWLILGVRALLFFNPVAQVVGRQMLLDFERRADDRAAEVTGDPVHLASALVKVARAEGTRPEALPERALRVTETHHVESRGHRLLDDAGGRRAPLPGLRIALTIAAVSALSFFVI